MPGPGNHPHRLYKQLARRLLAELAGGKYAVGTRLPAERDLAEQYAVSRPKVREALIALEVQGFLEVRVDSLAHVVRVPGKRDDPGFAVSAFELTEARLLFEGEAVALAATQISADELAQLEELVGAIATEDLDARGTEKADQEFHLLIARATRNAAIVNAIEQVWNLRETSAESALLHAKARSARYLPATN